MTTAFVLGNGLSRKPVDPQTLKQHGTVYGCNALYREFVPDVLVATDRLISTHIQDSGYALKNKFYTRKPVNGSGAMRLPKEYHGFSSGPNAVGLAAKHGHTEIYLLGFDLGPTSDQRFNNIYAGTEFYKPRDSQPTYTGNWIKQLVQILKDYPDTKFYRVFGPTTADIPELAKIQNLSNQDLHVMLDRINNKKDL